jgi:penicillin-binding protein 2
MRNRAVYGFYFPGSTFKTVVALAALEAGAIDPQKVYHSPGYYQLGKRRIDDLAGPGEFDFKRAFKRSSNPYFIEYGLQVGRDAIVAMGERLHFGEATGIQLGQDSAGILPTLDYIRKNLGGWSEGDTANLCIGQGYLAVTPLQMAVATAAVANGGKVLWPQLVLSIEPQDALIDPSRRRGVQPRIRDQLPVTLRTLSLIQNAMLADTEDADGTGTSARVPGYRVCGKTGTAQVQKHNKLDHHTVWFASYAPYENPHYAVVVMVDYGQSGGASCAPVAGKIYRALKYRDERAPVPPKSSVALK